MEVVPAHELSEAAAVLLDQAVGASQDALGVVGGWIGLALEIVVGATICWVRRR